MSDPRQWRLGADADGIRAIYKPKDKQVAVREDTNDILRFDASSSAVDDGDAVLKPTDTHASLPGRWLKANPPSGAIAIEDQLYLRDDFSHAFVDSGNSLFHSETLWDYGASGTGALVEYSGWQSDLIGLLGLSASGVAANAYISKGCSLEGADDWSMKFRAKLNAAVPDVTDDWQGFWGVMSTPGGDLSSGSHDVVGIGFGYSLDNSVRFVACVRRAGAGNTYIVTDITIVQNTYYSFEIVKKSGEVKFYIDGVLKATIDTNLPQVGDRQYPCIGIRKISGSNSRSLRTDYAEMTVNTDRTP